MRIDFFAAGNITLDPLQVSKVDDMTSASARDLNHLIFGSVGTLSIMSVTYENDEGFNEPHPNRESKDRGDLILNDFSGPAMATLCKLSRYFDMSSSVQHTVRWFGHDVDRLRKTLWAMAGRHRHLFSGTGFAAEINPALLYGDYGVRSFERDSLLDLKKKSPISETNLLHAFDVGTVDTFDRYVIALVHVASGTATIGELRLINDTHYSLFSRYGAIPSGLESGIGEVDCSEVNPAVGIAVVQAAG